MSLGWEHAMEIIDQITKTNCRWYTLEADRVADTYAMGACGEQRDLDKTVAQEVA